MKQLILISAVLVALIVCATAGQKNGKRSVKLKSPQGMTYISSGTLRMQQTADPKEGVDGSVRTVQMMGFFIDKSEVSNIEYREFVQWVLDSIANTALGHTLQMPDGSTRVTMEKINWQDPDVQRLGLYVKGDFGFNKLIVSKLIYDYTTFDYKAFSKHPGDAPLKYVVRFDVPVFPDTTVWSRGPFVSFNEPVAKQYFGFSGFNNYPVVGVTLLQANAFCDWRTKLWRHEISARTGQQIESTFRLPTEEEWELAALGGKDEILPHTQPAMSLNPFDDGQPGKGAMHEENGYGLRYMAGMVSEWTTTPVRGYEHEESGIIARDFYAPVNSDKNKRIVRGGNWCMNMQEQTLGVRFGQIIDSASRCIGFRCVFNAVLPSLSGN